MLHQCLLKLMNERKGSVGIILCPLTDLSAKYHNSQLERTNLEASGCAI